MEPKSLLFETDDSRSGDEDFTVPSSRRYFASTTTLSIAILIETLAILGLLLFISSNQRICPEDIGYYPAREAIHYYETTFEPGEVFMSKSGTPTKETDRAWRELQLPTDGVIQASTATGFDLDALPDTIHSSRNPSLATYGLEVFHQLHCLDRLRKSYHPGRYFPYETEHEFVHHREHCIDHLRQSIMCSGDIAMDRWQWDPEDQKSWLVTNGVPHVCRRFDSLADWVRKYRFKGHEWSTVPIEGVDDVDGR